eukprot:1962165-Rhodomonas_salina.1
MKRAQTRPPHSIGAIIHALKQQRYQLTRPSRLLLLLSLLPSLTSAPDLDRGLRVKVVVGAVGGRGSAQQCEGRSCDLVAT